MLEYGQFYVNSTPIKIDSLTFQIETIGNYARVKAIHVLRNYSGNPTTIKMLINLDDESAVTGYSFTNKHGEFVSVLKEKKQAKKDYDDARLNGYETGLMEELNESTFSVSIANIDDGEELIFTIEYVTQISIDDELLMMKIPYHSRDESLQTTITVSGTSTFEWNGVITEMKDIRIPIQNGITIMRDEDTDEIALASTFVDRQRNGDVNVIFLCDRSGSMGGERIKYLRIMLQLFLRQLPTYAKINIISYGSKYEMMFNDLKKFGTSVFNFATREINSFENDFGGPEMSKPLGKLINKKTKNCHIILLTDGEDWSKYDVKECVKELAKDNIIHAVGLSWDCDMKFMKSCAQLGNGLSVHVKESSLLMKEVSKITQRILSPSITNCEIKWNIEGNVVPESIPVFSGVFTSYIMLNNQLEENQNIECCLNGYVKRRRTEMREQKQYNQENIINNNILHQLISHQLIRKYEALKMKEEAIKLSLKYNVLCKGTAFVAVDKTKRIEVDDINSATNNSGGWRICSSEAKQKKGAGLNPCILCMLLCFCIAIILYLFYLLLKYIGKGIKWCFKWCFKRISFCCLCCDCCQPAKIKIEDFDYYEFRQKDKETVFYQLINLQRSKGQFVNVEEIIEQLKSFNYRRINVTVVQTFFVVEMMKRKYKDREYEWYWIAKKAQQWLDMKNIQIPEQMKTELVNIIETYEFR